MKAEVAEGRRQIAEAKEQTILDFKASKKLEDTKIEFAKKAFIKGFEFYHRRVVEKFSKLDLDFLEGEFSNEEVEPLVAGADLPSTMPAVATIEPTREPETTKDVPNSSTVPPPKVGDF